jgi:CRISPR-associated protein Cmr3
MSGTDPVSGKFRKEQIESLLAKKMLGPILVKLNTDGNIDQFLMPAPKDALFIKSDRVDEAIRYDLKPLTFSQAEIDLQNLKICGPANQIKEKPHPKAPGYWYWEQYLEWLNKPKTSQVKLSDLGLPSLIQGSRTHVGINSSTQVAEEGALFQTSALEFDFIRRRSGDSYDLASTQRFGIFLATDADFSGGVNHLGGEHRIVCWSEVDNPLPFGSCPEELKKQIKNDGHCRLLLLTAAYFEKGYLPTWLDEFGVTVEAVITERYQGVSGWDYDKNKPKPTRRLVPAGSVYFLKLPPEEQAQDKFIEDVWFQTVSDDPQLRLDGFGLAILGSWDGIDRQIQMEVKS